MLEGLAFSIISTINTMLFPSVISMYVVHECGIRVVFLEHRPLAFFQVVSLHLNSWTSLSASFALRSIYFDMWARVAEWIQPLELITSKRGNSPGIQLKSPRGDRIGTTATTPAGPVSSLQVWWRLCPSVSTFFRLWFEFRKSLFDFFRLFFRSSILSLMWYRPSIYSCLIVYSDSSLEKNPFSDFFFDLFCPCWFTL